MSIFRISVFQVLTSMLLVNWPIATQANPAWKPKISVPRSFTLGTYRPALDQRAEKRFDELLRQGIKLIKTGRYEQADRLLDQAVELKPNDVTARLEHARVLLTIGYLTWNRAKVEKAYRHIEYASKCDPNNRDARYLSVLVKSLLERMQNQPGRRNPPKANRANPN